MSPNSFLSPFYRFSRHATVRSSLSIGPAACSGIMPDQTDERTRSLQRSSSRRSRRSWADQLQYLPDGGLIRSRRMAQLEAALLISSAAVPVRKLVQLARLIDAKEAKQLIQILNDSYDRDRSAFRIELTAAGYTMMTRAQLAPWLNRLHQRQEQMKLSSPAMETLTIIAYQQPVMRADVEAIRGVQSSEMIRQLIDRGLVRIGGEDDSLGRPFLYVTTRQFLTMFGLQSLEDLPSHATLRRKNAAPLPSADQDEELDDGSGDGDGDSASDADSPDNASTSPEATDREIRLNPASASPTLKIKNRGAA